MTSPADVFEVVILAALLATVILFAILANSRRDY